MPNLHATLYFQDYDDFDIANEDDHLEEFLGNFYFYLFIFIFFTDLWIFFVGIPKKGSDLKEGGTAVDGDPTKLEGQPAVNGELEKR